MTRFSPAQAEQIKEIGSELGRKREEQSLSLEEIAAKTYIRLPLLQALEAGVVERLPEPVYVRGFIRRYSEILQVDGEAFLEKLAAAQEPVALEALPDLDSFVSPPDTAPEPGQTPATPISDLTPLLSFSEEEEAEPIPPRPALSLGIIPPWAYLALFATAAGLAGFYFLSRPPAPQPSSQETPPPVREVSPPSTPSPSLSPSPTPSSEVLPLSATVTLEGDSWLQVEVDGQIEYEGTLMRGETKTWKGKKQLVIKAGNAGAVNLSVDQAAAERLGNLGEVKEILINRDAARAKPPS